MFSKILRTGSYFTKRNRLAFSTRTIKRFCSKSNHEYDLCVIGCGSAGFAAATRGWDYGKKVAIINPKNKLGGATIHDGALSSKVMWQLSRQSRHIQAQFSDYKPSFDRMKDRVSESINVKSRHFEKQINDLSINSPIVRYSPKEDGGGGSITLFDGYASFESPHTISIKKPNNKNNNNNKTIIRSHYFLIATGSRPRIPKTDIFECDHNKILTSDDLLTKLNKFPSSMLIYGGGVIGCEFATIFSNFGITNNIYLFNERRNKLLPNEDDDLTNFLTENFNNTKNINLLSSVKMRSIKLNKNNNKLNCIYDIIKPKYKYDNFEDGYEIISTDNVEVDNVLLAMGREPNISSLNLHKANIKLSDNGTSLNVDQHLRCFGGKNDHIYAVGDALGKWGLVSVAEMEARHAVEVMFARKNPATKLDYNHISSVMFVRPEIACVGLNEKEAQFRKISYKSGLLRLGLVNRAVIDWNERHHGPIEPKKAGFVKLISTDDDDKTLIGMRAIGAGASSVIQTASLLIRNGDSIRELDRVAHPHPAITEGVQECARMLLGRGIYKPHVWPRSHVTHYSPEMGKAYAEQIIPSRYQQSVPGYMG